MRVDYSKIDYRDMGDVELYQVYHFPLYSKKDMKVIAHIEVLDFGEKYGSQAKILCHNAKRGSVSSGQVFSSIEAALNDALMQISMQLVDSKELFL